MPLGKFPRPDHREIYFSLVIGPLKIIYAHPAAKLEAKCHRCGWSYFYWKEGDCKSAIRKHLWDAHPGQPKPESKRVMKSVMPSPSR